MEVKNYKLTIEYLGTNYYGWQLLPNRPTISGEILKALKTLTGKEVKLTGASRTDAGVHAKGQVANFKIDREVNRKKLLRGLNGLLPPDIKVTRVEEVSLEFDSRRSAKGKKYLYRLFNREVPSPFEYKRSWFIPHPLNLKAMEEGAKALIGVHDFTSFSKKERKKEVNPIREVNRIKIEKRGQVIEFSVWGRSFLRHMVRVMVATLVKVGEGKLEPEEVKEILEARNRERAPYLAPAEGLYLEKVYYEDYPY
ncbi:tRNA pseudouridine(38-40) synthase TruA [Thermovibrio sp.]